MLAPDASKLRSQLLLSIAAGNQGVSWAGFPDWEILTHWDSLGGVAVETYLHDVVGASLG